MRVVTVRNVDLVKNLALQRKDTIVALGDESKKRTLEELKSDIIRLWRAEGFYRMALKADPTLVVREQYEDYQQELNRIGLRRRNLYSELAERSRFQNFRLRR